MKGSLVGNCPAVTIGIGGVTVECILDTGSMVSTITESFYNKYLCDIPIVQECHLKLRAANGLEIPYVGYIEADVYVQPVNLRLEKRGILIVKDTQGREIPGLLGMNIIKECKDLVISGCGSAAPKSFRQTIVCRIGSRHSRTLQQLSRALHKLQGLILCVFQQTLVLYM